MSFTETVISTIAKFYSYDFNNYYIRKIRKKRQTEVRLFVKYMEHIVNITSM